MGKRNYHIALRVATIHFSGSDRHFLFETSIGKKMVWDIYILITSGWEVYQGMLCEQMAYEGMVFML